MKTVVLLAVAALLVACGGNPSPRTLIDARRQLSPGEAAAVLAASRRAMSGRTLRIVPSSGGPGTDVLMGPDGLPKLTRGFGASVAGGIVAGVGSATIVVETPPRTITTIRDYTGRPARRCDGSKLAGHLVIEYRSENDGEPWQITARAITAPLRDDAFAMLRSAATARMERADVRGRPARAFMSAWKPPPEDRHARPPLRTGDPLPNVEGTPHLEDSVQVLWIDLESLLPVRWEVTKRDRRVFGYDFVYERIDLRVPGGVRKPSCFP